jgi:OOP family OmpA-OmpF porin
MWKQFFAGLLGAALVAPLAAQAEGSYFKADVGSAEYKAEGATDNKTAVSIAYGFSVDKNFDVELGYAHLGKVESTDGTVSTQTQSIYIAGVGNLPLTDKFSAFGKVGVAVNHFDIESPGLGGTTSETKTRALLGLGIAYSFTKEVAGTLEYQYFGKVDQTKISALTVGIKYGF